MTRQNVTLGLSLSSLLEPEFCLADRDDVAVSQDVVLDTTGVDEYAVLASRIDDSAIVVVGHDNCMATTDELCLKLNVIMSSSSNGESVLEQRESEFLTVNLADQ